MTKFKVGDKARCVSTDTMYFKTKVGEEVEITSVGSFIGATTGNEYAYRVKFNDGITARCNDEHLEPIIEFGSWKEIEDSSGWNPMKEIEHEI